MTTEMFKQLAAEFERKQIHWRAQVVSKDGKTAMALAYIDARDVMHRLDEVVGPENWATEHYDAGQGKLGCRLGLWIEDRWVWKSDGAGDTDIEAEKGAFSTAFKRAAVAWGIGRYLYDLPAPWVPCESFQGNDGKYRFKKFTRDPWQHVPKKKGAYRSDQDPNWVGPMNKTNLQQAARQLKHDLRGAATADDWQEVVETNMHVICQVRDEPTIRDWWLGKENFDGLKIELEKSAEVCGIDDEYLNKILEQEKEAA